MRAQIDSTIIPRLIVTLAWVYHGLVPKILHQAPTEWYLASQFGLSESLTLLLVYTAGVGEMLFGVVFWFLYRNNWINVLNIVAMIGLIVMVAVLDWRYLFDAFNVITTNMPVILCSVWLLSQEKANQS